MKGGYDSTEYFCGLLPKDAEGNTIFESMTEEEYDRIIREPQNKDILKRLSLDSWRTFDVD